MKELKRIKKELEDQKAVMKAEYTAWAKAEDEKT